MYMILKSPIKYKKEKNKKGQGGWTFKVSEHERFSTRKITGDPGLAAADASSSRVLIHKNQLNVYFYALLKSLQNLGTFEGESMLF